MHRLHSGSIAAAIVTFATMAWALAVRSSDEVPLANIDEKTEDKPASGPRYWKGNLHTHSLWSDGDDYPEMIADWYASHGYHFLSLTEHNVIAEADRWIDSESTALRKKATEKYRKRFPDGWVESRESAGKKQVRLKPLREYRTLFDSPGKFALIQGEEITGAFTKRPVHMNAINLRDALMPIAGKDMPEAIRVNLMQVADQQKKTGWPGLTFLNHPNFQWGVTAEDMLAAEELRFFEVYNGHPGVRNDGDATHASTERIWDILLAQRLAKRDLPVIFGVATDDAHAYHEFGVGKVNPGRGWVSVRAANLSPEAIVRGMTKGDFYCSSGVELTDIAVAQGELRIQIAPQPGVKYRTEFITTMKDTDLSGEAVPAGKPEEPKEKTDQPLPAFPITKKYSADVGKVIATSTDTRAVYKFTGKELYVRARITSDRVHPNPYAKGDFEMAWTQPVRP